MDAIQKRLVLCTVLAALLLVALFVPLPYPTTRAEKEEVIKLALQALISGGAVPNPDRPRELIGREHLIGRLDRMYFRNSTGIPDSVFLSYGLKLLPPNEQLDLDGGDVVVNAGFVETDSSGTWHLQFSYAFASHGGHGYEIQLYKSLLTKSIVFVPTWIA